MVFDHISTYKRGLKVLRFVIKCFLGTCTSTGKEELFQYTCKRYPQQDISPGSTKHRKNIENKLGMYKKAILQKKKAGPP